MMKYLTAIVLTSCALSVALAGADYAGGYHSYHGPAAPIGHDGRVVDTPEVAHARAAHLAALSAAASKASYAESYESPHSLYSAPLRHYGASEPMYFKSKVHHVPQAYHGPPAPLDHDGRVVDTPEVAHAKAAHFAAFHEAASKVAYAPVAADEDYSGDYQERAYHGPAAPLAKDGRVIDTPEVAHAKAAHLAAYQQAAHGAPRYDYYSH